MQGIMAGDFWTFLRDTSDRIFRYWVYKRVFTPLEQEKKYIDQSEYEDTCAHTGIIRECAELPNGDFLLGFSDPGSEYTEYYRLSEIRLAYSPDDAESDYDDPEPEDES